MLLGLERVGRRCRLLIGVEASLELTGAFEVLGELVREHHGGARRAVCARRMASSDDALDRVAVECLVARGVAQGLAHAREANLRCQREDPAHVVAGGRTLLLAQALLELGGGAAQSSELLAQEPAAAALAIEGRLVLWQDVALKAPAPHAVLGDDLVAHNDLEPTHQDSHPGLPAAEIRPDGVAVGLPSDAVVVTDHTRLDFCCVEALGWKRQQPRPLLL